MKRLKYPPSLFPQIQKKFILMEPNIPISKSLSGKFFFPPQKRQQEMEMAITIKMLEAPSSSTTHQALTPTQMSVLISVKD